jgi:hypothetical protein
MPCLKNNFTRLHGYIAAGLLAAFMALVLFFCLMNWRAIHHDLPLVVRATLATVTGPFDGVIARPSDTGAAWMAARFCLPACASFLALAVLGQIVPLPFRRGAFVFRIGTWTIGVFVWLAGAVPSLLNAID